MDFFDLHCDTLTQLVQSGGSLRDAPGCHVSLEKASAFGRWAQVYACFVPDDQNGKEPLPVMSASAMLSFAK